MADDFSLSAIVRAEFSSFTDAMSQIGAAAQSGMDRVRAAFGGASTADQHMTRLAESTRESSASIGDQLSELGAKAREMAEAFAVLEGLRWAKEQIAGSLEAGEQLTRMSQITGIGIGQLQQLQFAATATGGSLEQLSMFAQQVQRAVVSIQSGQGGRRYGSVLEAAGIDPNSIHTAQDALTALSGAVQRFGVQSEAVRNLLVTIGGRGGLELEPMLSKLPELNEQFEKLHIAMSAGDVATLNEANEQVNILGAEFEALRNKVVAGLAAPSIEAATQLIGEFIGKLNAAGDSGKMRRWGLDVLDIEGQVAHAAVNFGQTMLDAGADAKAIVDDLQSVATELNKINEAAGRFGDRMHDMAVSGIHRAESGILSAYSGKHIEIGGAPSTLGAGNLSVVSGAGEVGSWADAANAKIDEVIRKEKEEIAQRQRMTGAGAGGATGNAAAAAGNAAGAGKDNRSQVLSQFAAMEHARAEIAGGTAAQIQAADEAVYDKAVQLFGAQSEQAVRAYATEVEAARRAQTEKIAAAQKELSEEQRKLTQLKSLDAQELSDRAANQVKILQLVQQAHQGDVSVAQQTDAQINQIHQQLYSQLESLYAGDAAKYEKYEQMKIASSLTAARQILQAQEQANKQYQSDVQSTASFVSGKFNAMMEGAVRGTLDLRSIAQETFVGVIQSAIQMIVEKLLAMAAATTLVKGAFALLQGIMGGGSATSGILAQKQAYAQLAGSAMVATVAAAPFPIDLTAPAAGAAAMAAAASMAGGGIVDIPSAYGGMTVPGHGNGNGPGMLSVLHQNEMVLPAPIAARIIKAFPTPSTAPSDASGRPVGFNQGGGHHVETHVHINALDSESFSSRIDSHKEQIATAVMDAFMRLGAGGRFGRVG